MNKAVYVRDLESKCGSEIQDFFLVVDKRSRLTRKGSPYWELDLADCSGQVAARIWNCYEQAGCNFESGHIIELLAKVEQYRNTIQLNIERFRRLYADEVNISQLPKEATGQPDEFATLTEFGVARGHWVSTDVAPQIALATESRMEQLKTRHVGGPASEIPTMSTTPRRSPEKPGLDKKRLEELKCKYLGKRPNESF